MLPTNLHAEQFAEYPPAARRMVAAHLDVLRQLPLSFLPILLREVIDYDFKFPAERAEIDQELAQLSSLSHAQIAERFQFFSQLSLSSSLEHLDWINRPAQFVEQESAHLWSTRQLDAFRKAATDYVDRLHSALPVQQLPVRRLGIAVIGSGVDSYDGTLFCGLRKHGTYFGRIKPEDGLDSLLTAVTARAKAYPLPYGHWYVEGGELADRNPLLTCVGYKALESVRGALLRYMQTEIVRPGMGPEELRTNLARLLPTDLGMEKAGDPIMDRFQVKLLTEGSGTQVFSTTFAQWTAREALRRAQPLTLLVRFAPRQRERPMNELLSDNPGASQPDLIGSLVDADMAAYYQWINQQRLPGSEQSCFLVWFEGHNQAVAIGPSFPRNVESNSAMHVGELLSIAVS
jgi:hypothetical protein